MNADIILYPVSDLKLLKPLEFPKQLEPSRSFVMLMRKPLALS